MRSDESLLQAIIDNPDDDLPRLIYADYLDEHGDTDRADFIRVQCEQAQLCEDSRRFAKLVVRSEQLLSANRRIWLAPLADFSGDCFFRRGFVERVTLRASEFLVHAETIWQHAPVRHLVLTNDAWEEMERLAKSPYLARLEGLSLAGNHLESDEVATLLKSRHIHQLKELDLADNRLDIFAMQTIAASHSLPDLQHLDLSSNDLTSEGAIVLVESPQLQGLDALLISGTSVGPAGVEVLVSESVLTKLAQLDLSYNRIGRRGVRALLYSSGLRQLKRLVLRGIRAAHDHKAALEQRFGTGVCYLG